MFYICLFLLLQGKDEPESSHLFLHGPDRESKPLLQTVHHLDQPEDQEDLCAEEHVRVQAHQGLRQSLCRQPWAHGRRGLAAFLSHFYPKSWGENQQSHHKTSHGQLMSANTKFL